MTADNPLIVILSGPTRAGKNTVAGELAQQIPRCAIVDVDVLRSMVFRPHKAPWDGEEGRFQQHLGVKNACRLARSVID